MYLLALVIPSKTQFILSALLLAVWLVSCKGFPESKQPGRRLQDTRGDQLSGVISGWSVESKGMAMVTGRVYLESKRKSPNEGA